MNRHDQRREQFLQDPEVAEGYREMAAEFPFMQTIEAIRLKQQTTKEEDNNTLFSLFLTFSCH